MITYYHGGNTSFSNFSFRAPFRTPRCLGWGGGGGELAKEVDCVFMFCYYFKQAHFVMFSGLLGPPFYKAVILYSLLFSKFGPVFSTKLFVVLPNLWFEKLKLCPILLMLDWFHG